MHFTNLLTIFLLVPATAIAVNPFHGKNFYANSIYAKKLEATISTFLSSGDVTNAKRVNTVQRTGTFTWLSALSEACPQYSHLLLLTTDNSTMDSSPSCQFISLRRCPSRIKLGRSK